MWGAGVDGRRARSLRAALPLAVGLLILAGSLAGCAGGSRSSGSQPGTPSAAGPSSTAPARSVGLGTSPHASSTVAAPPTGTAPTTPPVVHTQMRQFAPLDENGEPVVAAHPGGFGTCFGTSIAVPVSGVFRCLSGNSILDPCFAPVHEPSPAEVYCFADPWSQGQIITLTKPLPDYAPDLTEGNPWAVQLSNGARCVAVTGAVPSLGDVDLSYACDTGDMTGLTTTADGSLVGHYGPAAGPLTEVGVTSAWRGLSYRLAD